MDWKVKCEYLQNEIKFLLQKHKTELSMHFVDFQSKDTMHQQLAALHEQVEALTEERNLAMDRALLAEQVVRCMQSEEKQLLADCSAKLEKISRLPYASSFQNPMLVYAKPTEALMRMQELIERQNVQLIKFFQKIHDLEQEKLELVQLNFALSNELLKHSAQENFSSEKFVLSLARYQQLLLQNPTDTFGDDPLLSPLGPVIPTKVQHRHKHLPEQSKIPKIDVSKAQQIQTSNVNMMKDAQTKQQALDSYEFEVNKLKQVYIEQHLQLKMIQSKHDELLIYVRELEATNEILITSNQIYQEKWSNLQALKLGQSQTETENSFTFSKLNDAAHSLLDRH